MTPREEIERIQKRQRIIGATLRGDPAWEILIDLADAGTLKTSTVGATTRVSQTTALRYLDQLERDGLIERSGAEDARYSLISLTPSGRETVERCLA